MASNSHAGDVAALARQREQLEVAEGERCPECLSERYGPREGGCPRCEECGHSPCDGDRA